MRKILTFILILCTVALFAEMRGGALYDPGAMRTGNIAMAATGIAAAPAYSFASDPNTGMYSPAADNLGVSVAGAEALRVNSAGEMLIATSTDAGNYKLQVVGGIYHKTVNISGMPVFDSPLYNSSYKQNFELQNTTNNYNDAFSGSGIGFVGSFNSSKSQAGFGYIGGFKENTTDGNYAGYLAFGSRTNGVSSFTDAMRINSAQEMLIATSTDAGNYKLQVNGNAYFYNDVSALSFTDRTPAPENLAESYAIIQSHEVKGKMLDHSKLHSAAWGTKTRINTTGRMMKRKLDDGKEVLEPETEIISEPDPDGRNLSITITAQALVIKDLIKRIEALEKNK